MADKLRIEDLKGIFKDKDNIRLGDDGFGPESGVPEYNKYGIYCDPSGRMEFLCVIMERDDPAANPDGPLTEDDYIPHSVARYDFKTRTWKSEPGNMNLVSSQSFTFLNDENEFFDKLQAYTDSLSAAQIDANGTIENPDERAP